MLRLLISQPSSSENGKERRLMVNIHLRIHLIGRLELVMKFGSKIELRVQLRKLLKQLRLQLLNKQKLTRRLIISRKINNKLGRGSNLKFASPSLSGSIAHNNFQREDYRNKYSKLSHQSLGQSITSPYKSKILLDRRL